MSDRLPSLPVTVGLGHPTNIISVNVPAAPLLPLATQSQAAGNAAVIAALPAGQAHSAGHAIFTPQAGQAPSAGHTILAQSAGQASGAGHAILTQSVGQVPSAGHAILTPSGGQAPSAGHTILTQPAVSSALLHHTAGTPTGAASFLASGTRPTVVSSAQGVLPAGHGVSAFAMYSTFQPAPTVSQAGILTPVPTSVVQLAPYTQSDASHVYLHHQPQQQTVVTTSIVAPSSATPTTVISQAAQSAHVLSSVASVAHSQIANPSAGSSDAGAQNLKVEDALSYLDQVKVRFSDNQSVYNDFLDTMRDFKAATIDTQEVINRVKTYFSGHPDLILGFNTFLPSGYKMKASPHNQTISLLQPNRPPVTLVGPPVQPKAQEAEAAYGPNATDQYEEFNHAISYVNKIKSRFAGKSLVYKQFLEILHKYQKDQRTGEAQNTEEQVLGEVERLFAGQPDLLDEFSQFLPQSAAAQVTQQLREHSASGTTTGSVKVSVASPQSSGASAGAAAAPASAPQTAGKRGRPSAASETETVKKARVQRPSDKPAPLLSPATPPSGAQVPSLKDFAFFDQLKSSLTDKDVYENFLRCLHLYNTGKVAKADLLNTAARFLRPFPQLLKWLREALQADILLAPDGLGAAAEASDQQPSRHHLDIDFNTLKRYGSSYRMLPSSYASPKCQGREHLPLCQDVLNDTLVSFPSWTSEDTQYVSSKKNQYEEVCYRVEDERYELELVLEVNNSAIRALESVHKRLLRMNSSEEQARFKLGEDLGGSSTVLQRKAIQRIYGEKAHSIIQGLQDNPAVGVPLVLRRLKSKAEEWREAQKAFNKLWREQTEKNYLKSLDHQSLHFKQSDQRLLRSRALVNEIATRKVKELNLVFPADADVRKGAVDLLIHHVKRQSFVQEEKSAMKKLLRHWLRQLLMEEKLALSDDEASDSSDRDEPGAEAAPRLLFGNNNTFVFLRLYHILCERLAAVKVACQRFGLADAKDADSTAVALRLRLPTQLRPGQHYQHFVQLLLSLLDGAIDSSAFEDQVRELLGVHHYQVFTLDKVVTFAMRQLHNLATEDVSKRLLRLSAKEALAIAAAKPLSLPGLEDAYRRKAERLLPDSQSEYLYRLGLQLADEGRAVCLTVRLLGSPAQKREEERSAEGQVTAIRQWSHYLDLYKESEAGGGGKAATRQVFLVRNVLQWIRLTQRRRQLAKPRQAEDGDAGADDGASGDSFRCQGILEKQWQRDTRSLLSTTFGFVASSEELFRDVTYWDQIEIRGVSERMCLLMYATGCESLFYRAGRLAKAKASHKRLSQRKRAKLSDWLATATNRIPEAERDACRSWLLGDSAELRPGLRTTKVIASPGHSAPPYHPYNRYQTVVTDSAGAKWPVKTESVELEAPQAEPIAAVAVVRSPSATPVELEQQQQQQQQEAETKQLHQQQPEQQQQKQEGADQQQQQEALQ